MSDDILQPEGRKNENCHCSHSDEKHIDGIICDVKNCHFHDCETHCTASHIVVGPTHADNGGETLCTTFKPKSE